MEQTQPQDVAPEQESKELMNIYLLEINDENDCLYKLAILAASPIEALKKFLTKHTEIDIKSNGLSIDIDLIGLIQ